MAPNRKTAGRDQVGDRLRRSYGVLGLLVAAAMAGACSGADERRTSSSARSTTVATTVESATPGLPGDSTPAPTQARPTGAQRPEAGFVVRSVLDGDTLTLADGRRVRLAQVDAPETDECYGPQSSNALRALVEGRTVTLRRPSKGPERDRYGRTVAEVSVGGQSVNERLVGDGTAEWYEQFAREDADLAGRLRSAEANAQAAGRGLWSACASSGPGAAFPPPTQALAPSSGACHAAYPGDCIPSPPPDLDCPDIERKVRVDHAHGDPHRFDANKDGWGCESYG